MSDPLLNGDPTRIGPYSLHARLGGGGMGQVFLGPSPGGYTVAVKVVRPDLAQDPDFRRRFAAEVTAARRVGGFYTAQVVDADTDATPPWLATAYIPGPTLYQAVREHGPLPATTVAVLGAGLAEGLAAVHAQGVVHRDLKPGNVLLAADGPRVIDFGIARALDATSLTHSSTVLGTAAFMSPEQARAEKVGPASDVFSLGCVLAFAATGRSPFGEGAPLAVMFRVVQEEPDLAGVPASLVGLVEACLAKDPATRPEVGEVVAALAPAVPSRSGDDGQWLPPDVTEVLVRYTRTYTRTQEPRVPPGDAKMPEPGKKKPPVSGRGPTAPEDAELVIGNLSPDPLEVLIDGVPAGVVAAGRSESFPVDAGRHTMQVDSAGRRGPTRSIILEPGGTMRTAFDVGLGHDARPEPSEQRVFKRDTRRPVLISTAVATPLLAVAIGPSMLENGTDANPVGIVVGSLIVGVIVLGFFFAVAVNAALGRSLTLNDDGLELVSSWEKTRSIRWSDLTQVSIVHGDRLVRVVVWPREDLQLDPPLVDFHGGKIVCTTWMISAEDPDRTARLEAALRWYADDLWVEQSTSS